MSELFDVDSAIGNAANRALLSLAELGEEQERRGQEAANRWRAQNPGLSWRPVASIAAGMMQAQPAADPDAVLAAATRQYLADNPYAAFDRWRETNSDLVQREPDALAAVAREHAEYSQDSRGFGNITWGERLAGLTAHLRQQSGLDYDSAALEQAQQAQKQAHVQAVREANQQRDDAVSIALADELAARAKMRGEKRSIDRDTGELLGPGYCHHVRRTLTDEENQNPGLDEAVDAQNRERESKFDPRPETRIGGYSEKERLALQQENLARQRRQRD